MSYLMFVRKCYLKFEVSLMDDLKATQKHGVKVVESLGYNICHIASCWGVGLSVF